MASGVADLIKVFLEDQHTRARRGAGPRDEDEQIVEVVLLHLRLDVVRDIRLVAAVVEHGLQEHERDEARVGPVERRRVGTPCRVAEMAQVRLQARHRVFARGHGRQRGLEKRAELVAELGRQGGSARRVCRRRRALPFAFAAAAGRWCWLLCGVEVRVCER